MTALPVDTAVRTASFARAAIYALLIVFAVFYLLPLYVMVVNSIKPLEEIRRGDMLALPEHLISSEVLVNSCFRRSYKLLSFSLAVLTCTKTTMQ